MKKIAIIIGGGSSIRRNMWNCPIEKLPLWEIIQKQFTIGTNWVYKYFTPTVLMYSDYTWYSVEKNNLKNIPLILGKQDGIYNNPNGIILDNNVILLKEAETKKKKIWGQRDEGLHPHYWGKDAWTKGWFSSQLIGIKALNLAIALEYDETYLLGMDATDINGHTHFYDDTNTGHYEYDKQHYCGVGKFDNGKYRTGNYNKIDELNNVWYEPFKQELEKGIQIYNVSLYSKINTFPKMSYDTFFRKINNGQIVDHNEIRCEIRRRLNEKM